MTEMRSVVVVQNSQPTIEGAGVHLKRAFGNYEATQMDPFLLLDDFHSTDPRDYIAGFPWHPHRGIETVTYVIAGNIDHGDSIGNSGTIGTGDIQWMTAGGGIVHQEMPRQYTGMMQGFQLWVNLPASNKMMAPRYRGITREQIKTSTPSKGVAMKVIAGKAGRIEGPVKDLVVEAQYLDVEMAPYAEFEHQTKKGWKEFAYAFGGNGSFGTDNRAVGAESLVVFGGGDTVTARAGKNGLRFLLVAGKPIGEPIAWRGPIVMNTEKELEVAFEEYWSGRFLKHA
jgi:redox-sensitive bicupin YhaK (pirin superfamily)